jgi:hypothetical protein
MMNFWMTPIGFLTPYILGWAIVNGLIVMGVLKLLKLGAARKTLAVTGLTTAVAVILWNWSIEFNQSTVHLNVDHPVLRISWADALDGVGVFALTALVLGLWVSPRSPAALVVKMAGVAALVTVVTDTFCF